MAFNPYYQTYQPNYYQPPMPDQLTQLRQGQMMQNQQQMGQPMQQVGQPSIPVPNQQNGIIWVGSKIEADNYLVTPNSAVALWDMNNPVVYLRQADSTGKPTTKVYDLVERTTPSAPSNVPHVEYVTREEFDALKAKLEAMTAIAAQEKRTTRKKESDDDGKPAI